MEGQVLHASTNFSSVMEGTVLYTSCTVQFVTFLWVKYLKYEKITVVVIR